MKLSYLIPSMALLLAKAMADVAIPASTFATDNLLSLLSTEDMVVDKLGQSLQPPSSPVPDSLVIRSPPKKCKNKKPSYKLVGFPVTATCNTVNGAVTWRTPELKAAGMIAGKLAHIGRSLGRGNYPHNFGNAEGLGNFNPRCKDYQEFPILATGEVFSAGTVDNPEAPDQYRLVFSVGKLVRTTGEIPINYCGLMAHPGILGPNGRFLNNFVECGWLGEVDATFG